MRGRQYPWGFVEVDNIDHSDFALLRRFIIQTHMQDLKDVTHDVHYENYRVKCLSDLAELQNSQGVPLTNSGQLAHLAAVNSSERTTKQRTNWKEDAAKKQLQSLGSRYDQSNRSTEQLLQDKDEEIKKMQQMLQQMQAKLESQSSLPQDTQV